jgi:LPXTG-motif cell wall-anchored protein
LIVQDDDSSDTESVTGLVQTGSGVNSNAINPALPLAGFSLMVLLAGLSYTRRRRA